MTSQQKDKYICQQLGVVKPFWENFTSEAGRVQLLKLVYKDWNTWSDLVKLVGVAGTTAIHVPYMTDDTGKFRDAVYRWMGGVE